MANKKHKKLAEIYVKEIMEARNYKEFFEASGNLSAIGDALRYANGESRLESDLRKFMKENEGYYYEDDIEEIMKELNEKIGKQVHFRTITLFDHIRNKLVKELQVLQDQWQTAKIIYALATLYNDDDEKLSQTIYTINDEQQRRNAVICARVYLSEYENVFKIFKPDTKI